MLLDCRMFCWFCRSFSGIVWFCNYVFVLALYCLVQYETNVFYSLFVDHKFISEHE